MKLEKIKLNGKIYRIICADVFSTNNELRASIVFEVDDKDKPYDMSMEYEDFIIYGSFFDLSNMEIDKSVFGSLYFDVDYVTADIARATIVTIN